MIYYNPASKDGLRWIENVSDGLRVVGFCDEVQRKELGYSPRDEHQGWYTDEDGDREVLRGVVYLLPHGRYISGYADPYNDDCARIVFSNVYENAIDAARAADELARINAEHEREYNTVWQAGRRYEELGEERKSLSTENGKLRHDMKGTKGAVRLACLNVIERNMDRVKEIIAERAELYDNYSQREGWQE
jgi:hypothetical protein